jgi:hypothetical protein
MISNAPKISWPMRADANAPEPELDLPVLQDRRRRHPLLGRKMLPGCLDRRSVAQDTDPEDRSVAEPLLDFSDASLGENLAVVDDRDARA